MMAADRRAADLALWLATGEEVVDGRVATPTCTVRIGTEDGVLPIYCGAPNSSPMVGNATGHSLCEFHIRTATRSTKNGTTVFNGQPVPGSFGPTAIGRDESESCQCGTPGCRVDHAGSVDYDCDTW